MKKINLAEKFTLFSETWTPKIVAELNDCHIKVAKFKGEFLWHKHDVDELFFVVKGELNIRFRDQNILLKQGELLVVEKHVEHMPVAKKEAHILLIEPKALINTGNVKSEKTVADPSWI